MAHRSVRSHIVKQLGGLLLEALDDRGMVQATDKSQKRIGT